METKKCRIRALNGDENVEIFVFPLAGIRDLKFYFVKGCRKIRDAEFFDNIRYYHLEVVHCLVAP